MNLADAIRQAALRQNEDQPMKENSEQPESVAEAAAPPEPAPKAKSKPEPKAKAAPKANDSAPAESKPNEMPAFQVPEPVAATPGDAYPGDTGKLTIEASREEATRFMASDIATGEPVPMPDVPPEMANGNVVRFEIFLSPEQLSCLFRALVATQHSMLTLREAAHYLRIPATTLEQLAGEGKIPALQLEGRWRFPKSGMDEWVMLQSFREGEISDAA